MDEGVRVVLQGKRVLLLQSIAQELDWQDITFFQELGGTWLFWQAWSEDAGSGVWIYCAFARAIHDNHVRLRLASGGGTSDHCILLRPILCRAWVFLTCLMPISSCLCPTSRKYSIITLKDRAKCQTACFEDEFFLLVQLPALFTSTDVHG